MRISAKAEYACVAMLELAANHGEPQPVRIKTIADTQGIPQRFLVQILLQLKTAGLVVSVRGAAGGYQLARSPEAISLADVINAIDDSALAPRTSLGDSSSRAVADSGQHLRQTRPRTALGDVAHHSPAVEALLSVWREIQAEEQRMLEKLSLAELLRRSQQGHALTYQI